MKEVSVKLFECSLDEVLRLPDSTQVFMYLPNEFTCEVTCVAAVRSAFTLFSLKFFLLYTFFTLKEPEFYKGGEVK